MKNESEHKTEFVNAIKRLNGWYAIRMEDRYAVGRPDILIGIPFGPTVLIEAKMIRGPTFQPEARQLIELRRFIAASQSADHIYSPNYRMSWMLGFDGTSMYLHTQAGQVRVEDCLMSHPGELPHEFVVRFWNKEISK